MNLYVAFHADDIERQQEHASASNAPDDLRRIAQSCDFGSRLWRDWSEAVGGSVVSASEGSGRVILPADRIDDLPTRIHEYSELVDSKISVGVGTTVSEADCALQVARKRGGDQILFYSPDAERELSDSAELSKAVDDFGGATGPKGEFHGKYAHGQGHVGMAAATMPKAPGHNRIEASEHSQGEAALDAAQNEMPPAAEQTHAGQDLINQFHNLAQQQGQRDDEQSKQDAGSLDDVRNQVVQALQAVKQQAPVLEQIKGAAPDLYQAVMGITQAMVEMAHQLVPAPEDPNQPAVESAASAAPPETPAQPEATTKKSEEPVAEALVKAEEDEAACEKCGSMSSLEMKKDLLVCSECGHESKIESLEKGKLPMPHASSYHHLELPVGAERDGSIKVKHGNGQTSWAEVRAGQVLSQDGHSLSARNPHGR